MNFNKYQILAQRTSSTETPSDKAINGIMGLVGESGECIDLFKKYYFQGHELDREKLTDELGDVLWYIAELATAINVPMEDIAIHNIEKLKKRYPEGFDAEKSINR